MKPSEIAPATSAVIKKMIDKYLDPDFIRCIEGGVDVAVELNKQKLDLICFTGSTFVGKIIAGVAAKNLTPCILELGGKCPLVVHETCDMQHTVDKICWAKFSNSGQTCISPDYVFVHESVLTQFIDTMATTITAMWGDVTKVNEQTGRVVSDFHFKRLINLLETAGGKVVYGGTSHAATKHIQPTLILSPNDDAPIMKEEIFGPLLPIKPYKNFNQVVDYINQGEKPLAVYFYGNPYHADAIRLNDQTSSGAFATNECIVQSCSHYTGFGGVGESGSGRYGGWEGYCNFTNRKAGLLKQPVAAAMRSLVLPPFTSGKAETIGKFFVYLALYN